MAYKIRKYGGKHTIKDTKSGKVVDIDIEKYMSGGDKDKGKKKKKKELSEKEVQEINSSTGVTFTEEGANSLFERVNVDPNEFNPSNLDLGRYKGSRYFNVKNQGTNFVVHPTSDNPQNASGYKEQLRYLQEINPDVNLDPYAYKEFKNREKFEDGGSLPKYNDGTQFDCHPDDIECQERKRRGDIPPVDNSLQGYISNLGNMGIIDENSQPVQPQPLSDPALSFDSSGPTAPQTQDNPLPSDGTQPQTPEGGQGAPQNNDDIYNIPNPYAGTDLPSAAGHLGESIKNKSPWGIAASSLKLAVGIGRNVVTGLGKQNRYNQVMKNYYNDQKKQKNPIQYLEYGGKKDEELATGEYIKGIDNENTEQFNAEIEQGEYFQTNQGDIAEVVGSKHSAGGEKIQMEEEDRVVSDKLKLGGEVARMLSKKYELKLKAKHTYSDVLDKFRKKSKFDKLVDEEAEIIKKIAEQDKVEDNITRDFNLDILSKKKEEVEEKKHPIEEQRKVIFDELFDIQEASKPKKKEDNNFADGGKLEALAKEYSIPMERAQELVEEFANGGKKKPGAAKSSVREGQSKSGSGFFGNVSEEEYNRFVDTNSHWFDFSNFNPSNPEDVKNLQSKYNGLTQGNQVTVDGKFGEQTASLLLTSQPTPDGITPSSQEIPAPSASITEYLEQKKNPIPGGLEETELQGGLAGGYLFPNESPLPPSSLQGTIKPERRFDRVNPSEIDVLPYLQSIKDREESSIQNLEGLSPNVRAAVLANTRANTQSQESQVRNQIDVQNLQSKEKAEYANAQIQSRETNASAADRLNYEQRQYRAQALTDADTSNYYNNLQQINKQKFMDIHNLNLINQTNEDVYFTGTEYKRKNSDQEILRQVNI